MQYQVVMCGMFVSSLFSDTIKGTFGTDNPEKAYKWDLQETAQAVSSQYTGSSVTTYEGAPCIL